MKTSPRKSPTAQKVVVREVLERDGSLKGYKIVSSRSHDDRYIGLYVYASGKSFDIGQRIPVMALNEIKNSEGYVVTIERET